MSHSETDCFGIRAKVACIITGQGDLNAEVVQLASTIKKNFKEPGV